MKRYKGTSYQIAIPRTVDGDGIGKAIYLELRRLGHRPVFFPLESRVPEGSDVVFLFGPFGKFLHIPEQFSGLPVNRRPILAYWNTEGLPDLRIPWNLTAPFSEARSWLGRLSSHANPRWNALAKLPPFSLLEARFIRFRYLGDYLYAHQQGWLDVFADISAVYAGNFRKSGIPALVAPFGAYSGWYADLKLDRDIDVLWMGKRATKRRSQALDQVREELRAHGVEVYMVDNIERPFVYGRERIKLLNRAKITLNLLRTWYDENSLRICMAAPNRSLVVSEPLLPHVPQYKNGIHYVSTPVEQMAKTILDYLKHADERQRIIENAYRLLTTQLTFRGSMQKIMDAAILLRTGWSIRRTLVREEAHPYLKTVEE